MTAIACGLAMVAAFGIASGANQPTGLPPFPTVYSVSPQGGCVETSNPRRLLPPSPGLRATALAPRKIRVEWWFRKLPAACRPTTVKLLIDAYKDKASSSWGVNARVRGLSGHKVLTYASWNRSPPDVAFAAAEMPSGLRSDIARVRIRRKA
jgi:hypothetical protein